MAGSEGASVLESPSYVVVEVYAMYIVIAFLLERSIHFARSKLQRCKRRALLIALNTVVEEVMMLGFISLLLLAFQNDIASICVSKRSDGNRWMMLSYVGECAPCLEDTHRISEDYKKEHQCPFWFDDHGQEKGTVEVGLEDLRAEPGLETEPLEENGMGRRLLASADPSKGEGGCGKGKEPFVSTETLHEAHIAIFCVAIIHIVNSVLMVLLASWKVDIIWRRYDMHETEHTQIVRERVETYNLAHGLLSSKDSAGKRSDSTEHVDVQHSAHQHSTPLPDQSSMLERGEIDSGQHSAEASSPFPAQLKSRSPFAEKGTTGPSAGSKSGSSIQDANGEGQNTGSDERFLGDQNMMPYDGGPKQDGRLDRWIARERDLKKPHNWLLEITTCFFKQFIRPVSREEFQIMRASFMLTHKRSPNFSFMDYLLAALDEDIGKVVSISVSGWLAVMGIILLLPILGWTTWRYLVFQILAIILLLAMNTRLIAVARCVTRGGHVRELTASRFWFGKPAFLQALMRLLLFLNSVIFAMMVFFTWQFGKHSCFFYGRNSKDGQNGADWFWVVSLVLNLLSFIHISLVSLPVYSFVVHMGADWRNHIVSSTVKTRMRALAEQVKLKRKAGLSEHQ